MVALLGFLGLGLDSARGYVTRSRLSRAVDAAALGGARTLRRGQDAADARARSMAAANGVVPGSNVSLAISFGTNAEAERTITVTATETIPTMFMRVLGQDNLTVTSRAVAAVTPMDMVLVLDQSGSLTTEGAFDELQAAAKDFVGRFSDDIDQVGLVSFQVRAEHKFQLDQPFTSAIRGRIDQMQGVGDTNSREGLRYGQQQLQGPNIRPRAIRILVFFTDGRPTAFRGAIGGVDRNIAVSTTQTGRVRGYFNNPDTYPAMNSTATPNGCASVTTCFTWNENTVRATARTQALDRARTIRQDGIYIYSIGLGNPNNPNPLLSPDMPFLREIANEGGIVSGSEPQGQVYFAPSAAELDDVFESLAEQILVRLAE